MLRFCLFAGLAVLASSLRDASLDVEPKCSKPGCGQYKKIAKDDQNAAMRDKYGASFVFSHKPEPRAPPSLSRPLSHLVLLS